MDGKTENESALGLGIYGSSQVQSLNRHGRKQESDRSNFEGHFYFGVLGRLKTFHFAYFLHIHWT